MIFLSIVMGLLAAIWVLDALRLRARVQKLKVLPENTAVLSTGHHFVVKSGVAIDEATQRAAVSYLKSEKLQALVLLPQNMAASTAFLNVQAVDSDKFRKDRIARSKFDGGAFVLTDALLSRMGRDLKRPRTQSEFAQMASDIKAYATTTMDLIIAPGLVIEKEESNRIAMNPESFHLLFGTVGGAVALLQILLLIVGLFFSPYLALAALLVFLAQPALVLGGSSLRVKKLLAYCLLRPFLDIKSLLLSFAGKTEDEASKKIESELFSAKRVQYEDLLADGTQKFFEPARSDCPICGSTSLQKMVSTADRFQFKPGVFTIERCESCNHKFQNPRLSIEGLEFYYKDFYDGLGEKKLEGIFGHKSGPYVARAKMLQGEANPSRWLDVGGGHGHFCSLARDVWPMVSFDALDLSSSVMEAQKKGWSDHSYRGLFPDLAESLNHKYDVISMSHYLEHTRDPAAEIEAAAKVLPQGGHLLIELPDPDSRFGRIFGSFWLPWFQPQHQHFLSAGNLERLLKLNKFEPIVWHRGEAHQPIDIMFSVGLFITMIARPVDMPWLAPTTRLGRFWNRFVFVACIPLLIVSRLLDMALAPFFRRPGWSNAYRVLARRLA